MGPRYQLSTLLLMFAALLSTGHDSAGTESPSSRRKGKAPNVKGMTLPCHHGAVRLGKSKGSVEVEARCKGIQPREKVSIEVSVARLRGGTGNIKAYRRHPLILGAAGGKRYGSCFRDRHDSRWKLYCQGEAEGSVIVKGLIWVGKVDPCGLNVSLASSPKRERCEGSCPLEYVYVVLAHGPPRGC